MAALEIPPFFDVQQRALGAVKRVWKLLTLNRRAPQPQGDPMKYRFDFQTYLLRHGATICREFIVEVVLDVSIGPHCRA